MPELLAIKCHPVKAENNIYEGLGGMKDYIKIHWRALKKARQF